MAGVRDNTVTNVVSGSIASFKSVGQVPLKSLKVNFNPIQEGDGDPSPSNIRPISGWTGCGVSICGINLYDGTVIDGYISDNGVIGNDGYNFYSGLLAVKEGYTYTYSFTSNIKDSSNRRVHGYDKNGNWMQMIAKNNISSIGEKVCPFTVPNGVAFIRIQSRNGRFVKAGEEDTNIQIREGSTTVPYELKGNQILVSWSDLGTVYGGYVDLISGEGKITHKQYICDGSSDEKWFDNGDVSGFHRYQRRGMGDIVAAQDGKPGIICDTFSATTNYINNSISMAYYSPGEMTVKTIDWATVNDFITYITEHPFEVIGELREPISFSFTPIEIKTLLCQNNIWSNADTVEAQYCALESLDIYKQRFKTNEPHLQSASGNIVSFQTDIVAPLKECKVYFEPIQASGTPSPNNVLPINGWTGCDLQRTGKNIAHQVGWAATVLNSPTSTRPISNSYGTTLSTTDPSKSVVITQSQAPNSTTPYNYQNGYFIFVDDNLIFDQQYTVSFRVTNITSNPLNVSLANWRLGDPSGNQAASTVYGDRVYFIVPYNKNPNVLTRHGFEIRNCGMSCTVSDFMVTPVDDTDITYEPYNGSTTSITLPSTFYGGYVDLTNGKIIATHKKITFVGNENWYIGEGQTGHAAYRPSVKIDDAKAFSVAEQFPNTIMSDKIAPEKPGQGTWYPDEYIGYINNSSRFVFGVPAELNTKNAVNEWIQEIGGIDVIYELATPVEYNISPVTLKTLKNQNNIWSNTNGITEVKYWTHGNIADKRKVVWNQTAKPINSDNWAPYNSSVISVSFDNGIATSTWLQQAGSYRASIYLKTGKNQTSGDIIYGSCEINPSVDDFPWGIDIGNIACYGQKLPSNTWTRLSFNVTCNRTSYNRMYLSQCNIASDSLIPIGMTCQVRNPIQVNLTQMFGAGNQPTKEEFEVLCAKNGVDLTQYHPYDEGTQMYWYF